MLATYLLKKEDYAQGIEGFENAVALTWLHVHMLLKNEQCDNFSVSY